MSKIDLTDVYLRHLPFTGKQYCVWDITTPSFGVRHYRTSTFVLKQKNRLHTIGRYPYVSLKSAREEARRRLARKYITKLSIRTTVAVELYLQAKKDEHRENSRKLFTTYLNHLRIPTPLAELTARQLYETTTPLSKSAANMAFTVFKAFLNWCVDNDYLDQNPLLKRKPPHKTKAKSRLLTDEEIKRIWEHSLTSGVLGEIFRSLILTGQRINQIKSFERTWLKEDTILFPAAIMKGKEDHEIPLTATALKHLPTLQKPFRVDSNDLDAFRAKLSIPHFTPHHFRHYFSTTQARLQTPLDVTEALLAHVAGSRSPIQRIYDRYDRLQPMREALARYEAHLEKVIGKL